METKERPVLPAALADWIGDAPLTDVSGWSGDRTWRIERTPCAYLKIGTPGKFRRDAELQRYWHSKGLSSALEMYITADQDYLVVRPVPGKDGIAPEHLAAPEKLARIFGAALRRLHETDFSDCPADRLSELLEQAPAARYEQWRLDDLRPFIGAASAETCAAEIAANRHLLKCDALVHGDYCLPNILLENWQPTGFIDIGASGKGDRHYDLVWGLWTVLFNLKDPAYAEMFLDSYGREAIDPARLRICALLSAIE